VGETVPNISSQYRPDLSWPRPTVRPISGSPVSTQRAGKLTVPSPDFYKQRFHAICSTLKKGR